MPSNGSFHRYPVDCWRFYPDSGKALENWGKRNHFPCVLLESFTCKPIKDMWKDYVAVFLKDKSFVSNYPNRIQSVYKDYTNGVTCENTSFSQYKESTDETCHLKVQLEDISLKLEEVHNELETVYNSRSWKITAPLRKVKNIFK